MFERNDMDTCAWSVSLRLRSFGHAWEAIFVANAMQLQGSKSLAPCRDMRGSVRVRAQVVAPVRALRPREL